MSAKFSFHLRSEDRRRPLPAKIIIGRQELETVQHVTLKLLAYCYFFRDRLEIQPDLANDNIPFVPDLAQLDYEMRPVLWVECGDCGINKLNKLAVKVPEAQIWILKPSLTAARELLRAMGRDQLRRDRYQLLAFDHTLFDEMTNLLSSRNQMSWYKTTLEPAGTPGAENIPLDNEPELHFDFNNLWFQMPFHLLKF